MVATMGLSELGAEFADLPAGGRTLAHSSSLFVMWPRGDHVRLGVETIVGNAYGGGRTGLLFQGAGVSIEYAAGSAWIVVAGIQGGAMIASATQFTDDDSGNPSRAGTHYKGSGLFFAPNLSFGRAWGRYELRATAKQVLHLPGTERLGAFDALYAGVSIGRRVG